MLDLETQIQNIHNPQDFNKLGDHIYTAVYGSDYQQINDDRPDEGNDGYIKSKGILIAKHCFKNLQKRGLDVAILKKAKSDLTKAKGLVKSGLKIKKWVFLTPYSLSNKVWMEIMAYGRKCGLETESAGPAFLAVHLLEHKSLFQEFPFLHVGEIDESLSAIKGMLNVVVNTQQADALMRGADKPTVSMDGSIQVQEIFEYKPEPGKTKHSEDYMRVLKIYSGGNTEEQMRELKTVVYSSVDPEAVLQAVLALVSWYKFSLDSLDDHLTLIDVGIDTAKVLKGKDAEAILWAEKGSEISTKFCLTDLDGWGRIEIANRSGLLLITPEEQNQIVARLKSLNTELNQCFKNAIDCAIASNKYLAITRTFSMIGSAAGQRAGHFENLKVKDRALFERKVCKSSFIYAKSVAAQVQDQGELAFILYNFAISLTFIGEKQEAAILAQKAYEIASKLKLEDILNKIDELRKYIQNFEPVYMV